MTPRWGVIEETQTKVTVLGSKAAIQVGVWKDLEVLPVRILLAWETG